MKFHSSKKNHADFNQQKHRATNFSDRWKYFSNIKGLWEEVMRSKGKRDKWMLSISTVGRLDFKKLWRPTSRRIDSEEENHGGGRVWLEIQTCRKCVLRC